ncbi:M56 family metallopeptidase [Floccifex sp.]|uniref:M56 family metallopeptidase n=1 Tax=Floccifex sp. TaxID=2815810 RepID=UPI003F00D7A4
MIFPIEFPFTKTIPLPVIMNPLMDFLNYELLSQFKVMYVLLFIWIIGIVIGCIKWIGNIISTKKIKNKMVQYSKKYKMSELLNQEIKPDYDVYVSDGIPSCMVIGFEKCIFVPEMDFTQNDIQNILQHEAQHLKQNDILFKQIVNLLTIFYWWFPPVYWLKKNINLYLEIRVDEKTTDSMNEKETLEYAQTLISVQKKMMENDSKISKAVSSNMIGENKNVLSYRVNYLLNKPIHKKTNKLLLCVLLLLPFVGNSIIFEAYFERSEELEGTYDLEDLVDECYLVEHKDGTYSLFLENELYSLVDPTEFIESGMKIVKE